MVSGFIIMFRESLEAILIIGIITSFLVKTGNKSYIRFVLYGSSGGILSSVIIGIILNRVAGGLEGRNEEIFEGTVMIAGAILLTTMIIWMMNQSKIARELENKTHRSIEGKKSLALFLVVFIAILREGVESVIFLAAARYTNAEPARVYTGAIMGTLVSLAIGYLIFVSSRKMRIKLFFSISNILLIAFAAGLLSTGVYELQEAGLIPQFIEHLYDINPQVLSPDRYPILHEKGFIGSILKGLFGYNGNPSFLEVVTYILYTVFVVIIWVRTTNKKLSHVKS